MEILKTSHPPNQKILGEKMIQHPSAKFEKVLYNISKPSKDDNKPRINNVPNLD
jgi:hypothetical protein